MLCCTAVQLDPPTTLRYAVLYCCPTWSSNNLALCCVVLLSNLILQQPCAMLASWPHSDYIWQGASSNCPESFARISSSYICFLMAFDCHRQTDGRTDTTTYTKLDDWRTKLHGTVLVRCISASFICKITSGYSGWTLRHSWDNFDMYILSPTGCCKLLIGVDKRQVTSSRS